MIDLLSGTWNDLIDRYVAAMLAPRDAAGGSTASPSTHDIAIEGRRRLDTIDAAGIAALIEALADPYRRCFVIRMYRLCLRTDRSEPGVISLILSRPIPEALFEPMLTAAILHPGGDGWDLVYYVAMGFGYLRTAEFFIGYLEVERRPAEIIDAMTVIYGLQHNRFYIPERTGDVPAGTIRLCSPDFDRDGLSDIHDELQCTLLRLFIRHVDPDPRRVIARYLDPDHEGVPEELRPIIRAAGER
jgi:hypothetical protein